MKYKLQKKQDTYTKGSNWKHFRLWEAAVFATVSSHTTHGYTWSSAIRKHTSLLYTSDLGWGGLTRQGKGGGRVEQSELPFISIRFWLQKRCCFHFRELAVFTSVKWFCGFSEVVLRCQTRIFSQFLNICVLPSHFTEVVRGGIVHWIFVCSSSIYCMRFSAIFV